MIEGMQWWPLVVVLVACESADDFPGRPSEIDWATIELAPQQGKLDGTGYEIEVPRGANAIAIGTNGTFQVSALQVSLVLDPEARRIEEIRDVAVLEQLEFRDDGSGWSAVETGGSTVFNYVYVDDGAVLCKAMSPAATKAQTERMLRICKSLRVTTPLANPIQFPKGLSPREVQAAMCSISLHHARALEPKPTATKKRKTKQQLAEEKKREEELEEAYAARQERCQLRRWSNAQVDCVVKALSVEDASTCVESW